MRKLTPFLFIVCGFLFLLLTATFSVHGSLSFPWIMLVLSLGCFASGIIFAIANVRYPRT